MAQIFISYTSEDRTRAEALAHALSERGWSVWWDRKIPLGKSFEEVIEAALAEARCVIVLWSAHSVASEWVRNEASEARRRGVLVPAFLERVEPPLAFRSLNGADLTQWTPGRVDPELEKLVERVGELLGEDPGEAPLPDRGGESPPPRPAPAPATLPRWRAVFVGGLAVAAVVMGTFIVWPDAPGGPEEPSEGDRAAGSGTAPGENSDVVTAAPSDEVASVAAAPTPGLGQAADAGGPTGMGLEIADIQSAVNNSLVALGAAGAGGGPGVALGRGFEVSALGATIAFVEDAQATQLSTLGIPVQAGAVLWQVEIGGPIAAAGLRVGDALVAIGADAVTTEDDLRNALGRLGPGQTEFTYRRGDVENTVVVDCPTCEPQ